MAMNEKTKMYTKEQLDQMPPVAANNLLMLATKIKGTGVVRRADGTVKYDKPERAGEFGEDAI